MCSIRKVEGTYSSGIKERLAAVAPCSIGPVSPAWSGHWRVLFVNGRMKVLRGISMGLLGEGTSEFSHYLWKYRGPERDGRWTYLGTGHLDVFMIHGRTKVPSRKVRGTPQWMCPCSWGSLDVCPPQSDRWRW